VSRRGPKVALLIGAVLIATAVIWTAQAPVHANFLTDLLVPFALAGTGTAFSFIPISIAALATVKPEQAGLASGLMNTSLQLGAGLGIAIASGIAVAHSARGGHLGSVGAVGLITGYHDAMWALGMIALAAIPVVAVLVGRTGRLAAATSRRVTASSGVPA
jgi:MFS family permease